MKNYYVIVVFLALLHGIVEGFIANDNCTIHSHNNNYCPVYGWTDNDWILREAEKSEFGHKLWTDRRFCGFETTYSNYSRFVNVTSVAFSVYSEGEFEIFLDNFAQLSTRHWSKSVENNNGQWQPFKIIVNTNNVTIEENADIIKTIDIHPDQIVIKSKKRYLWKWYKVADTFLEAEHVTDEKLFTLLLPPEKRCYSFYVLLCKECYLDLDVINSRNNTTYNITSPETCESNKCLNELVLCDIDEESNNTINIYRRHSLNETTGYWALLDIRPSIDSDTDNSKTAKSNEATVAQTSGFWIIFILVFILLSVFLLAIMEIIRRRTIKTPNETEDNLLSSLSQNEDYSNALLYYYYY